MVAIDDLQEVAHGLFKEPIPGPLKSKMAEIRHLGSWCQNAKMRFSQKLSNIEISPQPHLSSTSSQYPLFICCHSLARQPSPPWKSQIAHLDMHHLVFGINFQIHSVNLIILVSIHLLIHLSTHICHHPHSRHPSLLHSFTPGSKPTFSTNPSHRRFLLPTGLPHDNGTGPDLSCSSFCF